MLNSEFYRHLFKDVRILSKYVGLENILL